VQVALSTLSEKRSQLSTEVEDEERRIGDARRLRSSLRKGLHDAQKRVDGAGHRSRGALRQLQRLLSQASTFVAVEEEVANGGAAPPDGDAQPALPDVDDCMSDRHAARPLHCAALRTHTHAQMAVSFGVCTLLTPLVLTHARHRARRPRRYSVAEDMASPSGGGGLVGQLLTWARSVLSVRFMLSLSEVSLTLSPGPRRRRKRAPRPARPPRAALHEIAEAPDCGDGGDDGCVSPRGGSIDAATALMALPPAVLASPPASPGAHGGVSGAAGGGAAAGAAASVSPRAESPQQAAPAPRVSSTQHASVHELSMRLQRMQDGTRAGAAGGGAAAAFGATVRASRGGSGGRSSGADVHGNNAAGDNRFTRLVSIAGQKAGAANAAGAAAAAAQAQQRSSPAQQQQQQQQQQQRPNQSRADPAVAWPLSPLSPQNSSEHL
jgi:hypothetical protein